MGFRKLVLLAVVTAAGLCAADLPETGTWTLNLERSSVARPRSQVMRVVPLSDNSYRVSFDGSPDQYVVAFDSEGAHDNSAGSLRFARRISDRHSQQILKVNGRDIGSIDLFVSPDGKMMTCVYRDQDNSIAMYVYDKR